MRFFLLLILLANSTSSAPVKIYLVSGEEFEGKIGSIHPKQIEFVLVGSENHFFPYENIVAIRVDGALKTGQFNEVELKKLFPALTAGNRASDTQPENSSLNQVLDSKRKPIVSPEGQYLTFQGIQSVFNFRPTLSVNFGWTTKWSVHPIVSLCFENWTSRRAPDSSFHGEMFGVGIKGGVRNYFHGKQKWYLEGDMGGFHFFNGMLGGNRSYFGLGPFFGYQNNFENVVMDVNVGWMHVVNEPQVIPETTVAGTGFGKLDKALDLQVQSMESTIKIFYPYMRLEANFAIGLKL